MYVPNYIPEPLEVPGNVTEERYGERLAYVRRVSGLHALSMCLVAALAWKVVPAVPISWAAYALIGLLLVSDALRVRFRGRPIEARIAAWCLLPLVVAVAFAVASADRYGAPMWAACVGLACALVYSALCKTDYSFVGQYLLALIVSTVLIAGIAVFVPLGPRGVAWALLVNAAYLSFYTYDLASLLSRRRKGEELAAVVDLYRDPLNIFGYAIRVVRHWRKHRIWNVPK